MPDRFGRRRQCSGHCRFCHHSSSLESSNGSRTVRLTIRSVLIFTTAGKTFPTAKTAGSEAGSACAKEIGDLPKISRATTTRISARLAHCVGSARVTRALPGFSGTAPGELRTTLLGISSSVAVICVQVTEHSSHCQLAGLRNSRRLNLLCALQLPLAQTSI